MPKGARITAAKPSKYRAVRTTIDGVTFASKKEASRYAELKLLERAGEISDLVLQPGYDLEVVGGFVKDDIVVIGRYVADFRYIDRRHQAVIVEDVKSPATRTPIYRWKKKHVEAQYGIQIREV